ncbi:MAG: DUF1565 domain-containing protein [Spirochaetota bacterium]
MRNVKITILLLLMSLSVACSNIGDFEPTTLATKKEKKKKRERNLLILLALSASANNSGSSSSTSTDTSTDTSTTYYVSTSGDDSAAGTASAPLATISAAVNKSDATRVNVAAGTYSTTSQITLGNASLYGGYSSDFSSRDSSTNNTTIQYTGSSISAISFFSGSTPILDGFTISNSDTSTSSYGVYISSASPTVSNNTISGQNAVFISCSSSCSPNVSKNTITGGANSSSSTSKGVDIFLRTSNTITLSENTINGGGGTTSNGVYIFASSSDPGGTVNLTSNTITNSGTNTPSSAYGLYFSGDGTSSNVNNINITGGSIDAGTASSSSDGIYTIADDYLNVTLSNTTIKGGNTTGTTSDSYGIYVLSNTSNTWNISGSTIEGGNGGTSSGGTSYGVYFNSSNSNSITISGSTIQGGSQGYLTYGINLQLTNSSSSTTITGNTIHGNGNSSTNESRAVVDSSTISSLFANNLVYGGNGINSRGIILASTSTTIAKIYNNTIIGGTRSGQTDATAILTDSSATPDIQNNIFYVNTATTNDCIFENSTGGDPSAIKNNDFFGCSGFLYNRDESAYKTSISTMQAVDATNYTGNVTLDPSFSDVNGADNDLSTISDNNLQIQSSTGVNVRQGGLNLSSSFTTDFAGNTRTASTGGSPSNTGAAGWSMGAYEQD